MIARYIVLGLYLLWGNEVNMEAMKIEDNEISYLPGDLINNLVDDRSCIIMLNEAHLLENDYQLFKNKKYIPFIHVHDNHSNIAKGMNQACKTFIVTSTNCCNIFASIYNADKLSQQRNIRNYIILNEKFDKSYVDNFLNCKWISFFPHIYHIISANNNSYSQSGSYNILSHTLRENLKAKKLEVIGSLAEGKVILQQNIQDKLRNLERNSLGLVMLPYSPQAIVRENGYDGVDYNTMAEFSRRHNFTWNVNIIDNIWGDPTDNESVRSYYGMLHSVEYQAAVPVGFLSALLFEQFDFSTPSVQSDMKLLTPCPRRKDYLWSVFSPLQPQVWISLIGLLFGTTLLLHVFRTVYGKISRVEARNNPYTSYTYSLLYSIRILLGSAAPPDNQPVTKQLILCLSLTSIVLVTSYNCNLVCFLTVPLYESPIDTLEEFVDSGLHWGTDNMIWVDLLRERSGKIHKTISERYLFCDDYEKLNKLVREKQIALMPEQLQSGYLCNVDFLDINVLTQLHVTREKLYSTYSGYVFHKGSPLLPSFNKFLRYLRDSGLITHWESFMSDSKIHMQSENVHFNSLRPLSFSDIDGSFMILIIGLALSFVIFIGDWIVSLPWMCSTHMCRKVTWVCPV